MQAPSEYTQTGHSKTNGVGFNKAFHFLWEKIKSEKITCM